ncbi:MAG: hypothetical protein WCV84_04080 [Patescibacteria group bacterium]
MKTNENQGQYGVRVFAHIGDGTISISNLRTIDEGDPEGALGPPNEQVRMRQESRKIVVAVRRDESKVEIHDGEVTFHLKGADVLTDDPVAEAKADEAEKPNGEETARKTAEAKFFAALRESRGAADAPISEYDRRMLDGLIAGKGVHSKSGQVFSAKPMARHATMQYFVHGGCQDETPLRKEDVEYSVVLPVKAVLDVLANKAGGVPIFTTGEERPGKPREELILLGLGHTDTGDGFAPRAVLVLKRAVILEGEVRQSGFALLLTNFALFVAMRHYAELSDRLEPVFLEEEAELQAIKARQAERAARTVQYIEETALVGAAKTDEE